MKAQIPENLGTLSIDPETGEKSLIIKPVTDEEIEEVVAASAKFREKLNQGIMGAGVARARYAAKIEPDVKRLIAEAKTEEEKEKWTKLLSRVLRDQGRYDEAIEVYADAGILNAKEAHDRNDDEYCNCENPRYQIKQVYSAKYGGDVNMYRCLNDGCGHTNVTPNPPPTLRRVIKARGMVWPKGKEVPDAQLHLHVKLNDE